MPDSNSQPSSVLGQLSRERALRDSAWVAEFLNVSKSWVEEASAAGTLPTIRIGEAVRFDPAIIKAWGRAEATMPDRYLALLEELSADVKALKGLQKAPALLLSFRQAAKLLKVDRITTLKVLVESGQLAVVNVNGRDRIQRGEVERLASEGFDRDAPAKKTATRKAFRLRSADLESAILKLKI